MYEVLLMKFDNNVIYVGRVIFCQHLWSCSRKCPISFALKRAICFVCRWLNINAFKTREFQGQNAPHPIERGCRRRWLQAHLASQYPRLLFECLMLTVSQLVSQSCVSKKYRPVPPSPLTNIGIPSVMTNALFQDSTLFHSKSAITRFRTSFVKESVKTWVQRTKDPRIATKLPLKLEGYPLKYPSQGHDPSSLRS